jgi:hypothetical protein
MAHSGSYHFTDCSMSIHCLDLVPFSCHVASEGVQDPATAIGQFTPAFVTLQELIG